MYVPLPTVPSYHCKARASLCYGLPARPDSAGMESCLVSRIYQMRSMLWLCIFEFNLPANTPRYEMVVSVDDQPDLPNSNSAHRAGG